MIACWLLYAGLDTTETGELKMGEGSLFAEDAMKLFARSRTEKGVGGKVQGVSGPSQKRYVHYFEQLRWRMMQSEEEQREEGRRKQRRKQSLEALQRDEEKEATHAGTAFAVSPISSSPRSPHAYTLSSPRTEHPVPVTEEKENVDVAVKPSHSLALTPLWSSSSTSTGAETARGSSRRSGFLSYASRLLFEHPKCEVLRLVLNNAVVSKEKELQFGDEKSRDEWNDTWNHRDNWTLVITHYRPILPRSHQEGDDDADDDLSATAPRSHPLEREEEKRESEAEQTNPSAAQRQRTAFSPHSHLIDIPASHLPSSSSSSPLPPRASSSSPSPPKTSPRSRSLKRLSHLLSDLNAYNQHRYEDVHEYFFRARPKETGDDDTSVTFDISSFEENSKSLILSGDLKFQIYRGKVDVGEDDQDDFGISRSTQTLVALSSTPPSARRAAAAKTVPGACAAGSADTAAVWMVLGQHRLPAGDGGCSGAKAWRAKRGVTPPPSELILRKNQLDEAFQASDIDSEFNLYLYYHCPPCAPGLPADRRTAQGPGA